MEKFLGLRSDQFTTDLTAEYLEFIMVHNDWFKKMLDKEGLDIWEIEAAGTMEDQDFYSGVFLGGEVAVWLRDELLKNGFEKGVDPVMEDYGWCFTIRNQGREFTVDIWDSLDEAGGYDWIIRFKEFKWFWQIARKKDPKAVERLAKVVEQVLENSTAAINYKWFSQNPFVATTTSEGRE